MPSTKLCRHKNDKDKDPTIKGLRLNSLWGRTYPHFSDKEKCNSQVYYLSYKAIKWWRAYLTERYLLPKSAL